VTTIVVGACIVVFVLSLAAAVYTFCSARGYEPFKIHTGVH
jgi:multisubunit Na+/H+ antiporter MnhC subunit